MIHLRSTLDRAIRTAPVLLVVPLAAVLAAAEDSAGSEEPLSRLLSLPPPSASSILPPLGPDELESVAAIKSGPTPTGVTRSIHVDRLASIFGGGEAWERTAAGTIWRTRLGSSGARGLRLHFRDFDVGDGRVWLIGEDGRVLGEYSGNGPFGDGDFWSRTATGDSLTIEYRPASEPMADSVPPFLVDQIGHLWDPFPWTAAPRLPDEGKVRDPGGSPVARSQLRPTVWEPSGSAQQPERFRAVRAGLPVGFDLAASSRPTVFTGEQAFAFEVREGTELLEFEVNSANRDAEFDVFVRRGRPVEVADGAVAADFRIPADIGGGPLTIRSDSGAPLQPGTYFVALGASIPGAPSQGTLMITPRFIIEDCFTDLVCRADEWGEVASAVARILIAGDDGNQWGCSGSVIADRGDGGIPYFLTAAHCVQSHSEARSLEAHWYYQNAQCSGRHEADSRDERYQVTSGSELLAFEDGSLVGDGGVDFSGDGDIALLRLLEVPPTSVTYAGWSSSDDDLGRGRRVIGIHHAQLQHKQIGFGRIVGGFFGFYRLPHMSRVEWGNGLTLGGASGSPLLNESGQVIGVLSGGRDDDQGCFDSGTPAGYSNFRSFFPQVRPWLEDNRPPRPTTVAGGDLTPGIAAYFRLLADEAGTLQTGERSFTVSVPIDATKLELTLASDDPTVNVDMFVRQGSDLSSVDSAHWRSTGPSGNEELVIERDSDPPLRMGTYYVTLRLDGASTVPATGTLIATLDRGSGLPLSMEFVSIPPGEFVMGTEGTPLGYSYRNEQPATRVTITSEFELGRYEVTQGEWQALMGTNPASYVDRTCGPTCPATGVSWTDAQGLVSRLNGLGDGFEYRLPTEAEWEYAARAGSTDDRYGPLDRIAWYRENSGGDLHPVGQKLPNSFGLYDMLGNASEWVRDWDGAYPGGSVVDPSGSASGSQRVVRGCEYDDEAENCRAAFRGSDFAEFGGYKTAVRLVRTLVREKLPGPGGTVAVGDSSRFQVGPNDSGIVLNGASSFVAVVPQDARWLRVVVLPGGGGEAFELLGRQGEDNSSASAADWSAEPSGGLVELLIGPESDPPLRPGSVYLSLVRTDQFGSRAEGTISVEIGRDAVPPGMEFVSINAGTFLMGTVGAEPGYRGDGEGPATRVRISSAFELGRHEVTRAQWEAVMGSVPSPRWGDDCGPRCPVEDLSWDEVQTFLARLNAVDDGFEYRLPTEAEWEYSARAGGAGDRYGSLGEIAWYSDNSDYDARAVGLKTPNGFGLYDMIGNVAEWVSDWEGAYPGGTVTDPSGPSTGRRRAVRGCSYRDSAEDCRARAREFSYPDWTPLGTGFRLARGATSKSRPGPGGMVTVGTPVPFRVSPEASGTLQNGEQSFVAVVPQEAKWLRVTVKRDGGGDGFELRGRHGSDNAASSPSDWTGASSGGVTELLIGSGTFPPLRAGPVYLSIVRTDRLGTWAAGTIAIEIGHEAVPPGLDFVSIQAGEFLMGTEGAESDFSTWDERPVTRVRISSAFQLGKHEVTRAQWKAVMGTVPPPGYGDDCGPTCPVADISWHEAQTFVAVLNRAGDGYEYSLPTEAEWEYAARAGSRGDRYGRLDQIAWYLENSGFDAHSVGLKIPNSLGLYDMLGNVREWVQDWYGDYPGGTVVDWAGLSSGYGRVRRGCAYNDRAEECRAAARDYTSPENGWANTGLRLARRGAR